MGQLPAWRKELDDPKTLGDVYEFAFNFYKEAPEKKSIGKLFIIN